MSYRFGSIQVTKLQFALIIGTPLAIGIGYFVYKKATAPTDDAAKSNKKSNTGHKDKLLLEKKKKRLESENESLTPLNEAKLAKNEGNLCYRNGKFDDAITFYDKAIEKCPSGNPMDLAIFYQNRAAAYEMLKKWNAVKDDCTKSLELNPRYAKAYYRRAKAHEATKNYSDCLDDVTATCILEMFQNNTTIMYADRILKETGRHDAENALIKHEPNTPSSYFIRTFLNSFYSNPFQTVTVPENLALQYAMDMNNIESDNKIKGYMRAKLALDNEHYDDIISACTEEIESSESEAQYKTEALLLRATFHMLCGSYTDSLQDFNAIVNNENADINLRGYAYILRGSLRIQMDQKEQGLLDFDEGEKLLPNNADVYHQRAQIYILIEQLDESLVLFEKSLKLAPDHGIAFGQKCYAEYRKVLLGGDQMGLLHVINEFYNSVEKFPNCVECYSLLAQVLCDQQQFDKADQYYEKALKLQKNNSTILVHRAVLILQWTGDMPKAINLINKAIEADPKCELAYETLGTIEVQRANLERAVELFEKAIRFARSKTEMAHLYALRNAAKSQINVTKRLDIDVSKISALAQSSAMAM